MEIKINIEGFYFNFIIILIVASLFFISGCSLNKNNDSDNVTICVQSQFDSQQLLPDSVSTFTIKVAVSSMLSPKETHIFYQDLFRYMSEKLGYNIEFIQRKTYKEVNDLLIHNNIDLPLICSGGYIEK